MNAFISYSSADRMRARKVAELFRQRGIDAWIDEAELRPGDMLTESLSSAISKAKYFVILITSTSILSKWVKYELNNVLPCAIDGGVRIIPLVFDNVVVPDSIRGYLWVDCSTDDDVTKAVTRAIQAEDIDSWDSVGGVDNDSWVPKYGIRLVQKNVLNSTRKLGLAGRPYVMIGDYDQQAGQTLRAAMENLFVGRYFDLIEHARGEWAAVIFEIGRIFYKSYDVLPATWKAMYRILTDKRRLGLFDAPDDAKQAMGKKPRDYYEQKSAPWESWVRVALRERTSKFKEDPKKAIFGLHSSCFQGNGIGGNGSRLFLMQNKSVSSLNSRIQELGYPDDGIFIE